jgi:phosphatidylglycerophosphate synthase
MTIPYAARDVLRVPGLLTLARLPLAVCFPFAIGRPAWAIAVLGAAALTDVLDGWAARRFHAETTTGALLDAIVDKVFVLTVAVTLLLAGELSIVQTLLLGTRDAGELPLVLRIAADRRARESSANRSSNIAGKLATVMQFLTAVAAILPAPPATVWAGVALSAAAGAFAAATYWWREGRAPVNPTPG